MMKATKGNNNITVNFLKKNSLLEYQQFWRILMMQYASVSAIPPGWQCKLCSSKKKGKKIKEFCTEFHYVVVEPRPIIHIIKHIHEFLQIIPFLCSAVVKKNHSSFFVLGNLPKKLTYFFFQKSFFKSKKSCLLSYILCSITK